MSPGHLETLDHNPHRHLRGDSHVSASLDQHRPSYRAKAPLLLATRRVLDHDATLFIPAARRQPREVDLARPARKQRSTRAGW